MRKSDDIAAFYHSDSISALDARFEAQKIAFAPFIFQSAYAMRELGLLSALDSAGEKGLSAEEVSQKTGISAYGTILLLQAGLGTGIVKLTGEGKYTIGKIGYFINNDSLTKINMDFMQDVCYEGAKELANSIRSGKPEGLKVFGRQWKSLYEALSSLPEKPQSSWFSFDHNYSNHIFPEALSIVFSSTPRHIIDIGGNTAEWAITCTKHDKRVKVTIVDLPGQVSLARKRVEAEGLSGRIETYEADMLSPSSTIPSGADAIWMSQFLDCFSLSEITSIAAKVSKAVNVDTRIFVLEPLIDRQEYLASAFSLQQTSLYFTCIANGNSKMYTYDEIVPAICKGGLELVRAYNNLGIFCYTLLEFRLA